LEVSHENNHAVFRFGRSKGTARPRRADQDSLGQFPSSMAMMAKLRLEPAWREEFKRVGEAQSRGPSNRELIGEPKRQITFRWGGDQAGARRLRDQQTHHYFHWTFVAVVAAIIVGLIAFGLTFLH
jgi:hypothetical protein